MLPSRAPDAETPTTYLKGISVEGPDRLTNWTSGANPSGNRRLAPSGQKGVSRSGRKWMNLLPEKFASVLVTRVYVLKRLLPSDLKFSISSAFVISLPSPCIIVTSSANESPASRRELEVVS